MLKPAQFTLVAALLVAPAALAAGEAASTPAAPAPTLGVPEDADQAKLRQQLEQVRALNAQLRSEREALQRQVDELEAKVAAENKRLGIMRGQPAASSPPPAAGGDAPYFYAGMAVGVLAVIGGLVYYRRRRAGQ